MIKYSPVLHLHNRWLWRPPHRSKLEPWLCHRGCNALWVLDDFKAIRISGSDKPIRGGFKVMPKYGDWSYILHDNRYGLVPADCIRSRYQPFADWLASFNTSGGPVWIWIEEA